MATISKFEDLDIWKLARKICQKVFDYTNKDNFSRDFSLKDQIRRSSGSIMDIFQKALKGRAERNSYNIYLFQKALQENVVHNFIVPLIEIISQKKNLKNYTIY